MSWYDNASDDPSVGPITPIGKSVVRAAGYSLLELERAGLSEAEASQLGIAVDRNRLSMVGTNVMQLKRLKKG
jgi:ribosomal protein L13E